MSSVWVSTQRVMFAYHWERLIPSRSARASTCVTISSDSLIETIVVLPVLPETRTGSVIHRTYDSAPCMTTSLVLLAITPGVAHLAPTIHVGPVALVVHQVPLPLCGTAPGTVLPMSHGEVE